MDKPVAALHKTKSLNSHQDGSMHMLLTRWKQWSHSIGHNLQVTGKDTFQGLNIGVADSLTLIRQLPIKYLMPAE